MHTHTDMPSHKDNLPSGVFSWHPVTGDKYHRSRGVGVCRDPTSICAFPPPPFLGRGEDYTIPTPTSHSLSSGVRGVMWSLMWSGGSGGVEPGSSSALAQSRDLRGHTKAGIDPGRAWWWNLPPPMILIPDKDCWGGRRRRRRRRKGLREEW